LFFLDGNSVNRAINAIFSELELFPGPEPACFGSALLSQKISSSYLKSCSWRSQQKNVQNEKRTQGHESADYAAHHLNLRVLGYPGLTSRSEVIVERLRIVGCEPTYPCGSPWVVVMGLHSPRTFVRSLVIVSSRVGLGWRTWEVR
jgi:hypothetical protein